MLDFLFKKNVAIFVDGPNMIRKDTKLNLAKLKRIGKKLGNVVIAHVYLDQYAPQKLIEAVLNQGFSPIITSGDVDVAMAVDLIFYPAIRRDIKKILLVTRDTDYISALQRLKEMDLEVYVATYLNEGTSKALKNYADKLFILR